MKITKRQLRRIIKEEKAKILRESYTNTAIDWAEMLGQLIDQDLSRRGIWYAEEGAAIIQALERLRHQIKDEMQGPSR